MATRRGRRAIPTGKNRALEALHSTAGHRGSVALHRAPYRHSDAFPRTEVTGTRYSRRMPDHATCVPAGRVRDRGRTERRSPRDVRTVASHRTGVVDTSTRCLGGDIARHRGGDDARRRRRSPWTTPGSRPHRCSAPACCRWTAPSTPATATRSPTRSGCPRSGNASPTRSSRWRTQMVDELRPAGRAELRRDLAGPLAVRVMALALELIDGDPATLLAVVRPDRHCGHCAVQRWSARRQRRCSGRPVDRQRQRHRVRRHGPAEHGDRLAVDRRDRVEHRGHVVRRHRDDRRHDHQRPGASAGRAGHVARRRRRSDAGRRTRSRSRCDSSRPWCASTATPRATSSSGKRRSSAATS